MNNEPLLRMQNIRKVFSGVVALDDVNFTLERGEVHSLVGENGAGKSTLIKVMTGAYKRDGGEMFYEGKAVNFRTPEEAQNAGRGQDADWSSVYDLWKDLVNALYKGYQSNVFAAWTIPCLYVAGKYLRVFAIKADAKIASSRDSGYGSSPREDASDPTGLQRSDSHRRTTPLQE